MKLFANLISTDWRDLVPIAGLAILAGAGAFFLFRKKPEDTLEMERERRAYINRIGRIVEGHILEVVDHTQAAAGSRPEAKVEVNPKPAVKAAPSGKRSTTPSKGAPKLLYYSYSISGVTYETAQDVTGLEEQAHIKRISVGQSASVKYDPSNPSNSILLADDWSGIH